MAMAALYKLLTENKGWGRRKYIDRVFRCATGDENISAARSRPWKASA